MARGAAPFVLCPLRGKYPVYVLVGTQRRAENEKALNCDDINVVEVGKHRFALTQLRVNGCESRVLSDGVEGGHKRVALFAALRLPHLVLSEAQTWRT